MVDRVTPDVRSRIMSSIKGKDTKPEIAVRKTVWGMGIRYRLHSKAVPGTPDISNRRRRLAVFVDGCFWHGCPRCYREPQTNTTFWRAKVERNRKRRHAVREDLERQGFQIAEIWEHDAYSPSAVIGMVESAMGEACGDQAGIVSVNG